MSRIFITTEFDPFHNGHKYLIDTLKSTYEDASVICGMSGAITQRGDFPCYQKYVRAAVSVLAGSDVTVLLPYVYASQGAEMFARGAVMTAAYLRCDKIAFGATCTDMEKFRLAVNTLKRYETRMILTSYVSDNVPFPMARIKALEDMTGEDFHFLYSPNDILALEYFRALDSLAQEIEPVIVKRSQADDFDTDSPFISATKLRNQLRLGRFEEVKEHIPYELYNQAAGVEDFFSSAGVHTVEGYKNIFLAMLIGFNEKQIELASSCKTSTARRLKTNAFLIRDGVNEYARQMATKNLTVSRIRRTLIDAMMGYTKDDANHFIDNYPDYAMILALSERGRKEVRELKDAGVNIITKPADGYAQLKGMDKRAFNLDIRAQDMFDIFSRNPQPHLKYTPFVSK